MTLLWVAGSWGIGVAVERTRSLAVAAGLHLVFNLARAWPLASGLPALAASGVAWWVLLRQWPPPADDERSVVAAASD
jgi:membrane protease YdiL (CAAX protease family)